MLTTPEVPSILVGLGPFGARVVARMQAERERALHGVEDGAQLSWLAVERGVRASAIAERVVGATRELLAHRRMVTARDHRSAEGLTRLHVFIIAHLGDADARAALGEVLRGVERRLLAELAPIFEPFRTGPARNLVVLPVCAMPHPASVERGAELVSAVRALSRQLASTPARERAVPQLFLIEDVAEFSVLGDAELAQCLRNFLTLLVYSLSAVQRAEALLYGGQPADPLATFVCATAELPRDSLRTYATDTVALEVIDAVLAPRDVDAGDHAALREIDALEEVELAAFDEPRDADRDVLELLGRYAPSIDRDAEPAWWEPSERIRARYGPDPNDPSLDAAQPSPEPPVGWALARMREIESTWRMLQRRRFDDVIAGERERIAKDRDAALSAIQGRVDKILWADASPDAFHRANVLAERMERAVSLRLEDAITDRDAALPVGPPSFESFKDAHAQFLDEVRRRPDLGATILWGALFVAAVTWFLPITLRALADALSIDAGDWQSPILRDYAWLTSLFASLAGASLYTFFRYRRAHLTARAAFHAMYDALEGTVNAPRDSVLEYFASRLRLAREVARVEALLAVRSTVLGDAERLTLIDRAARRARGKLLESLRAIGVERDVHGRLDPARLFGRGEEALVESLLPPETPAFLEALLPAEARDARVRDVLAALARDQRYRHRWREEAPFTSIDALRMAARAHAEPVATWDPLALPESAEATARQLASFARRQARSLHVALNVSGHDMHDADGTTTTLEGELIVPPRAFDPVRRMLTEEGAAGRTRLPVHRGVDPDRAFYVLAIGGIADDAVASLRTAPPAPENDDTTFEIER